MIFGLGWMFRMPKVPRRPAEPADGSIIPLRTPLLEQLERQLEQALFYPRPGMRDEAMERLSRLAGLG